MAGKVAIWAEVFKWKLLTTSWIGRTLDSWSSGDLWLFVQCAWVSLISQSVTVCTLLPMNCYRKVKYCEHVGTSKLHLTLERLAVLSFSVWPSPESLVPWISSSYIVWTVLQHISCSTSRQGNTFLVFISSRVWSARSGFCLPCIRKPIQFPRQSPTIDNIISHHTWEYSTPQWHTGPHYWLPSATTCLYFNPPTHNNKPC